MSTHRKYDLAVVTGTYPDKNTGAQKNRYQTIGSEMEMDDGSRFILLDPLINLAAVPRGQGKDRIMVSKFEPRDHNQQNNPANQASPNPSMQNTQSPQGFQNGYYNPDGSPMNPQQVAAMHNGQR